MDKEELHKHPRNIPGKYYVVYEDCLDHGVCDHCAGANFRRDDDVMGAYCYKQPSTWREEKQCRTALQGCPVAAIRDDGETTFLTNAEVSG